MAPVSVATSTRCVAPSLPRVPQAVAEHQPAFRIGVDHFDGLALRAAENVARLDRAAARHVLRGRHDADDADRRAEHGDRAHRARHGGAARHVVLHPLHAVGRLDRNAAGVEGDAFADQAEDRVRATLGRVVAEDHQRAAARCCRARRRAAGPCRAPRSDARRGSRPRRRLRLAMAAPRVGELARRQRVAGLVRELAREIAALAEHAAARDRRPRAAPGFRATCRARRAARSCSAAADPGAGSAVL